ncbi:LLM class flavin-dependent oxidoreductase [Sporolactobacillus sp. THM7-7]|nr:LLM class flavin-dependent oxidoreductase [Sporolactobacillus sp. THM7-7]
MLKLSILEQAPVSEGSTPAEALKSSTRLAQEAERLGYRRIWFAEHHDTKGLASCAPEIMIAHVAACTSTIHVGSGGVLLPHYSPYKVAENFGLLENLYPGRIDLGMGRAPGGMPGATWALNDGARRNLDDFPRKVRDLIGFLTDRLPEDHPLKTVKATPHAERVPELFLLGSSDGSSGIASEIGTPFMFAHFINPYGGSTVVRSYRSRYQPSRLYPEPRTAVCVFAVCADTDEEAERQASSLALWMIRVRQGQPSLIPTIEQADRFVPSEWERQMMRENRGRMIVGNPEKVRRELENLAAAYQTDEVMLITNIHDFEAKVRSFQLIAEAFHSDD